MTGVTGRGNRGGTYPDEISPQQSDTCIPESPRPIVPDEALAVQSNLQPLPN